MDEFHVVSLDELELHLEVHDGLGEIGWQFQLGLAEVHLVLRHLLLSRLLLLEYGEHQN